MKFLMDIVCTEGYIFFTVFVSFFLLIILWKFDINHIKYKRTFNIWKN